LLFLSWLWFEKDEIIVMGQDELVLRVAPDPKMMSPTSHMKHSVNPDPATLASSKQRSHSRESSGASNLSVKFTVHSDGSSSPKASVTTPYQYDGKMKPVTSCLRKRPSESDATARLERQRRRRLQRSPRRSDDKSEDLSHEESFYGDSEDSCNMEDVDRLSPDLVDGTLRDIRYEDFHIISFFWISLTTYVIYSF
jgi:hypothetical protein